MQITIDHETLQTLCDAIPTAIVACAETAATWQTDDQIRTRYENLAADYEHAAEIARALLYHATVARLETGIAAEQKAMSDLHTRLTAPNSTTTEP
jgi:hypothetical protein